ncbi:MAG TPA: esterase, partial [Cytophagales bacterium]|nr:esterase [Cytophagales bacterium]
MKNITRVALATALLATSPLTHSLPAQTLNAVSLEVGIQLEKAISADEYHVYSVELENGMGLLAEVQQQGISLLVDVMDAEGDLQLQINRPRGADALKENDFTAPATGRYTLVLHAREGEAAAGSYTLRVTDLVSLAENTRRIMRRELPTETLFNLWEASLTDPGAVSAFVEQHEQQHLIEPIAGDDAHMLVTYFCVPSPN